MDRWFEMNGPDSDVIISSRVRLARNDKRYPFPEKLDSERSTQLLNNLMQTLGELPGIQENKAFSMTNLDSIQKKVMLECHAITPYLYEKNIGGGFISPDENNVIMLNEEDHIRIQSFTPGNNLLEAYNNADAIDDIISLSIPYAYSDQYGYLTTCPSSVGTGMRVSYMMHLPALANTKRIRGLANEVGRFGLAIKGMYVDGNDTVLGDIYQITTLTTLGMTEKEIIRNLRNIGGQIVAQERASRREYIKNNRLTALDAVYRSYGVLRYARRLTLRDAMILLSEIRLGLAQGLITISEAEFQTYQLMIGIQPANLCMSANRQLEDDELDEERATYIRQNLPQIE